MTLLQIKYVLQVAQSKSLNKASQVLYVSQPSLTASIHALEEELGITIFHRSSKGVTLTNDGMEFVENSRLLYQNYEVLQEKYLWGGKVKKKFAVSTQHYSFALRSFVEMVKSFSLEEYEFAIRETRTMDVILDVSSMRSELGLLYLSDFNKAYLEKLFLTHDLEFHPLIDCEAYVYLWKGHPLAGKASISFEELREYPCLCFEQGEEGSLFLSEEILTEKEYERTIRANDRASMLNLMVGLNGYTLCSGIISEELNGSDYLAIPFRETQGNRNRIMHIGYVTRKNLQLSRLGERYVEELRHYLFGGNAYRNPDMEQT